MKKLAAVLATLVCFSASFLAAADEPSDASWQTFIDGTYKVLLRCPADWKPHACCELGPGMFAEHGRVGFGFSAAGGDHSTARQLCEDDAEHVLRPFGTSPTIRPMKVQGQIACLIWPSADQKKITGDNDAELIVHSPQPLKIRDTVYSFLMLNADKDSILALTHNLKFLALDPQNAPFLMEIGIEGSEGRAAVFRVGEPVVLAVTLSNNSDRTLHVPFSDPISDYRFKVSSEGVDRMPVTGKYQQLDREHKVAPPVAEPVTINPHSVYQTKIEISSLYQLPWPGNFTIQGQIKLPVELGPGLVNSNTLRVTVVAAQGK
jgi:hypothetical protein